MNAAGPQFPTTESLLPAFLAACVATPSPWTALQDALWECGITTHITEPPPPVSPDEAVKGGQQPKPTPVPGDSWEQRVEWRRQHARTTHTLTINDSLGRSWEEWRTLLQWAAVRQFQFLTAAAFLDALAARGVTVSVGKDGAVTYTPPLPALDANMAKTLKPIILALLSPGAPQLLGGKVSESSLGACFGDEFTRYVISVDGETFDYALYDAYVPLMRRAFKLQRKLPEVAIYGEGLEPADMGLVLSLHLMRYRWQPEPIPVAGYADWNEGEVAGLLGAAVDFYRRVMDSRGQSALLTSGHWKQAAEWEREPLDVAAQEQVTAFTPVIPEPDGGDLRDSVWKALHEAAQDPVDAAIIKRRWQSWTTFPFREPYASIAKDLGISAQAISRRWQRLRKAAREVLPSPASRPRLAYKTGERELLWEMEGLTDLTGPGRIVSRVEDPAAFTLPPWRWAPLAPDDALDGQLNQRGLGYGPDDLAVMLRNEAGELVPVERGSRLGMRGVLPMLMDQSVRHHEDMASEGQEGWTDDLTVTFRGHRDASYGYSPVMAHRPGAASVKQRNRLADPEKVSQATSVGEKTWNVGPSKVQGKLWTVTGLGRRSPDGPAGTESAGFGELHIEQGPPRKLSDGRPIPPMPEEDCL
jgi:hypothetical protein